METKTCKVCGRDLPLTQFANNRYGTPFSTCRECVNEKRAQSRYERSQIGGGKAAPASDELFDGNEPSEVMRMMGRAKKWLESRGFVIQLSGEYHETKIRKLKFE
nr:hypothetical protein [Bacteroides acidifaciens]